MLRVQSKDGWWLITHGDHARLAAEFAAHWGNRLFAAPRPRGEVLEAIKVHDDGWSVRDGSPTTTREGKPAAFSEELVGKYSAFEEIDLADYLAVRESAVEKVESRCAYAALLVSLHTHCLLTERADRSTIARDQLPLLDHFLARQRARQGRLREAVRANPGYSPEVVSEAGISANFFLLQATDHLSLLTCVDYPRPATLLRPIVSTEGTALAIEVQRTALRSFRLAPYPLDQPLLTFALPARHVTGRAFRSAAELAENFSAAPEQHLAITITA